MVGIVRQDNFFQNTGVKICRRKGYVMQGQTIYIKYKDKALIRETGIYQAQQPLWLLVKSPAGKNEKSSWSFSSLI